MTISLKADPSGNFGSILINGTEAIRVNPNGIPASSIGFTPSGNIAANNVQAAIQELDTDTQNSLAAKLSLSGGTMTGQINGITPTAAANLTRKDYVDGQVATKLNLSGGTMTGALNFSGAVGAPIVLRRPNNTSSNFLQFLNQETGASQDGYTGYAGSDTFHIANQVGKINIIANGAARWDFNANTFVTAGVSPAAYGAGTWLNNGGTLNLGFTGSPVGNGFVLFGNNSAAAGAITLASANSVTYGTSSDHRLKDNTQPLTGSGEFIDALRPTTWTWKADGAKGAGFIAHEVQEVSPSSVVGEKDAVNEDGTIKAQLMEYGSAEFIANIVAELQSLRRRVAESESKLDSALAEIAELKAAK